MARENFSGAAHADLPKYNELEKLERGNAISRALVQLKELGVQQEWEDEDNSGIFPGGIEEPLKQMQIGQQLEGLLKDGTHWLVERNGPIEYDVSTSKE
jgi:hypothetical protein